jgi:formiminotetrahydrofolate cyclodeaminase
MGAYLNVQINAKDYEDPEFVKTTLQKGKQIEEQACIKEKEILEIVHEKIRG